MDGYEKAVAYFDLLDEVRELPGVGVDLVTTGAVKSLCIARDSEHTRELLHAVERGSTIIGEVITVLSRRDCGPATRISHARLIVGYHNRLVHEYPQVDDESVCAIGRRHAPVPRAKCAVLLQEVGAVD